MAYTSKSVQFLNIDSSLEPLTESEVTAQLIETRVCSQTYRNLDEFEKRIPFVLELSTRSKSHWEKLIKLAPRRYWIKETLEGILVFDANQDCGYIRTYRLRAQPRIEQQIFINATWVTLKDEETLYRLLDTPAGQGIFNAWYQHMQRVTELPIEFVTGRLTNTSVEKAFVFTKGDGCAVCGGKATCYAAATMGSVAAAVMVQLPVCPEHLASAKAHPSTFDFLASLFSLSWDWPGLIKLDAIPDNLIPALHALVATELGGTVGSAEKREKGWHLRLHLPSGWEWLLRIKSLTDYAYMLFEPGKKKERYRADSAPDHPDVPFFPIHQHAYPDKKKKDNVTPSFLYGHPLFDIKRLRSAGQEYGAY